MALEFATLAQALVRLDVGAGRHFLQEDFDGLRAFFTLEGQDAGWFEHDVVFWRRKSAILAPTVN
jgi:hypothetical protein